MCRGACARPFGFSGLFRTFIVKELVTVQGRKDDPDERERRIDELEKEYDAAHSDPENQRELEELYFQLSGLIGKNNLHYLQKYTDRLIARYNIDPGWFYRRGREDARRPPLSPKAG